MKNVTGLLATETISIGDNKKITALAQQFVMVSNEVGFENLGAAGIVGLGISNSDQIPPLIATLKEQKVIESATFSLFLNNNNYENDDRRKPKSMLIIGTPDFSTYSDGSSKKTYPVYGSTGLWSIQLDKITCKDTEIDLDASYAVLDSRSSKIVGPIKTVKKLFDRFEAMYGCGYYYIRMVCDCSEIYSIVKFPTITFELDGDSYVMTENDYFKKTSKTCYLMFESADIDYWIFGQPFLRNYYSVYNYDTNTIELVNAASSRFTVETDSNWWIIPVVLIIGGAVWLFAWLGWVYYKKYSADSKLLVEQQAREND